MSTFRLLHTADWHLGKRLWEKPLLEEQKTLLDQIIQQAEENQVHAVVVAGDIFDSQMPSFDTEKVFAKALHRLSSGGTRPVLLISGNHDSNRGIEAFQNWAFPLGILLMGSVPDTLPSTLGECDLTYHGDGLIELYHPSWPFPMRFLLSPHVPLWSYPLQNGESPPIDTLIQRWHKSLTYPEQKAPTILVAHLYVRPDAEDLAEDASDKFSAGGQLPPLSIDIFPSGLSYVAMGHIHRPYAMRRKDDLLIAYAGSLMQYSFGDRSPEKQTWLVEIEASGRVSNLKALPLQVPRKLLAKQAVSSFEEARRVLEAHLEDFVELLWMGETVLSPADQETLRQFHERFRIIPAGVDAEEALTNIHSFAGQDLRLKLPEWFKEYYRLKEGAYPSDSIMELFEKILNKAYQTESEQTYMDYEAYKTRN